MSSRKGLKMTRWELMKKQLTRGLILTLLATNLPYGTVLFFIIMLYTWCLKCMVQKYDLHVHQNRVVREANEGIRRPT